MIPETLTFYDAAYPPSSPPRTDGVCIYIGGDTPHVWTLPEIVRQGARFRLPIFVRSNPTPAGVQADIAHCLAYLRIIGCPKGSLVALDVETAIDADYVRTFSLALINAGYPVIVYGSVPGLFGNREPDGLYWGASWTDVPHLCAGTVMTQYATFRSYDADLALSTLPLWDAQSAIFPTLPAWQEILMQQLPTVKLGATGIPVRTVQGLCCARGMTVSIDGVFGAQTALAVRGVQSSKGVTADGIVGPETWPILLAIQ